MSTNYELLHVKVQQWINNQGFQDLRPIQNKAIPPIIAQNTDVIISAPTASGKTEAAFLPLCSLIANANTDGLSVLCISPLKALISDQANRLESLCNQVNTTLTPWHGDVGSSTKKKLTNNPNGIMIITPESLEAILMNHLTWAKKSFSTISHIVIDEFHAFLDNERGCQLQSLINRIEWLCNGRIIPRIALSATLNNMSLVASILRQNRPCFPYVIIEDKTNQANIKLRIKSYIEKQLTEPNEVDGKIYLVEDLYKFTRGKSNLVFPNSRSITEELCSKLVQLCKENNVPNEYYPHYGNLNKDIRFMAETRLKENNIPTTVICTSTLELGIDIGSVYSVTQINSPPSVASLRQRMGRSGRRGEDAIINVCVYENETSSKSDIEDLLHIELFTTIAMLELTITDKWCEYPDLEQLHLSTLIQQTLAIISGYGSVTINALYQLLIKTGPFKNISKEIFVEFLRNLKEQEIISQSHDDSLVLGENGEKLVNYYSFYAVFYTPEEYKLVHNGKTLGTIPINEIMIAKDLPILFNGCSWLITSINSEKRTIILEPYTSGKAIKYSGEKGLLQAKVRQKIFELYSKKSLPYYIKDNISINNFNEAISLFDSLNIANNPIISHDGSIYIFHQLSDKAAYTLNLLFKSKLLNVSNVSKKWPIHIEDCSIDKLNQCIKVILNGDRIDPITLIDIEKINLMEAKYDYLLNDKLMMLNYITKNLNINEVYTYLDTLLIYSTVP